MKTKRILQPCLSATALRWIAIVLMVFDHTWLALVQPEGFWMTCLGRLSFPLFAFLTAQGCVHTSNFKRYALRLAMFGVISEIPYNLFAVCNFTAPARQNVMFTLLLGLLVLRVVLWAKKKAKLPAYILALAVFAAAYVAADRLKLDYRGLGMTTVVMFGVTKGMPLERLMQTVCLVLINYLIPGRMMQLGDGLFSIQNFASLAMIFILLYNGKKGSGNKLLQLGAYTFYPAHLSILVLLRRFLL